MSDAVVKNKLISFVIPVYQEQEVISSFLTDLIDFLQSQHYTFEVIIVDDGSSDLTVSSIEDIIKSHKNIGVISFSRNFGKEQAIRAGLLEVSGDCAIIMDADYQHPLFF